MSGQTLVIHGVDFALLEKQRNALIDVVCSSVPVALSSSQREKLEGLLGMLDEWSDTCELLAEMMPVDEIGEAMARVEVTSNMLEPHRPPWGAIMRMCISKGGGRG